MRPLAAVAVLSLAVSLASASEVGSPLEKEYKAAAEQVVGTTAGQGLASAGAPAPVVTGKYGVKPGPALKPAPASSPQTPIPPAPQAPGGEKDRKPTTGEMVGGLLLLMFGVPLVVTTGAKLLEEETKKAPFKDSTVK